MLSILQKTNQKDFLTREVKSRLDKNDVDYEKKSDLKDAWDGKEEPARWKQKITKSCL